MRPRLPFGGRFDRLPTVCLVLGCCLLGASAAGGGDDPGRLERLDALLAAGEADSVVHLARELVAGGAVLPRNVWRVRQRLAAALLDLDRPRAAMAELEAALAAAPEDPALHLNLGRALWRLGRRGHAVAELEYAVQLVPDRWLWRLEYADALLQLGIVRDALHQIHLARALCGDCTQALRAEINLHLGRGDPAAGLGALRLLFAQQPRPEVRRLLAAAHWAAGEPQTVAALLDSVAVSDLDGDEMMLLIQSDRRLAHADRALEWVRAEQPPLAGGWDPPAEFWAIASEICLSAGHLLEALKAIDRALARDPQAAVYHHNRAVILIELGREDAAEAALAEAQRLGRDSMPEPR